MDDATLHKIAMSLGLRVEYTVKNDGTHQDHVMVKRRGLGVEFVISQHDFRRIVEAAIKEYEDGRG